MNTQTFLVVIKGKELLLVMNDSEGRWDIPSRTFHGEPTSLRIEMSLSELFQEISLKDDIKKIEDERGSVFYMCFVEGSSRAHKIGTVWFASKYNLLPTVLTEFANAAVSIPQVQSRLS